MSNDSKKRDPASEALIALRKAMGKTQQQFAVEVMDCAVNTVARWETTWPPRGNALGRLRDIAYEQGFDDLVAAFQNVWLTEAHEKIGTRFLFADKGPEGGSWVSWQLEGEEEVRAGKAFLTLIKMLESPHEEIRGLAVKAVAELGTAVGIVDRPVEQGYDIGALIHGAERLEHASIYIATQFSEHMSRAEAADHFSCGLLLIKLRRLACKGVEAKCMEGYGG